MLSAKWVATKLTKKLTNFKFNSIEAACLRAGRFFCVFSEWGVRVLGIFGELGGLGVADLHFEVGLGGYFCRKPKKPKKAMKNLISLIAILLTVIGCNTTNKTTSESNSHTDVEVTKQSRKAEIEIDSLFQQAIIVLDSVEMEIPMIQTKTEAGREKTRLKSQKMIIGMTNKQQSVTLTTDTSATRTTNSTHTINQICEQATNQSIFKPPLFLLLIVTSTMILLWSMLKK